MSRSIIKKILSEEVKEKTKDEIAIGLAHKGMQHLTSALRDIESALQYAENPKIRKVLDEVRKSLMFDYGRQEGFAAEHSGNYDNIINLLGDMIDNNSQDNWNFNLNGDPSDRAPKGSFE
jgi:hypothetical protein